MYKNIIFDIGGVLISYRFAEMMIEAGYKKDDAIRIGNEIFDCGYWDKLDAGLIDYEEVKEKCLEKYPEDAEGIRYLLNNPDKMAFGRPKVWEKVRELKEEGYKIYVLSNYSKKLVEAHTKDAAFWEYVDGAIISYQVKCIKPDLLIYQKLINEFNLKPEQCLFFDDRPENVLGAIKAGMDSIVVESMEQLIEEIDKLM